MTRAAAPSPLAPAPPPPGPTTALDMGPTQPTTPLSSSSSNRPRTARPAAPTLTSPGGATTPGGGQTGSGGGGLMRRIFGGLRRRAPRASTQDIGGLGEELPPSPPRGNSQADGGGVGGGAEASPVTLGGATPIVPPSPLRSVGGAGGEGLLLAAASGGSGRFGVGGGLSPTLSLSQQQAGATASAGAGAAAAAVTVTTPLTSSPTGGAALDAPRTLGSILPTNRAKEAAAAAAVKRWEAEAAASAPPSASALPPPVAVVSLPLPPPPPPPSDEASEATSELRRRLVEAEARAASSEEAVRRLASEVWALRRQVALLSGVEKEEGEGGDKDGGACYYDNVVVGKDVGVGQATPAAAEAALMPLPRISPGLLIAEGDIAVGPRVGIGAFGEVWKGLYQGRPVAIKCFRAHPPTAAGAGGNPSTLAATAEMVGGEIRLMERVGGKPHVLPLEGVFVSRGTREIALVLPFMANGSLHDLLLDARAASYRPSVSMNALVRFALQAAHGVKGLHEEGVIHRDLACRNLLVDAAMNVFVSDFGFARMKPPTSTGESEAETEEEEALDAGGNATQTALGPVRWEAPESLRRKEYSEKTDAFAFGVCLYEMVARSLPWKGLTHALVAHHVLQGTRLAVPINADPALAEIMRRCWEQDPRRRPNFEFIYRRLKARHTQLQNEEREVSWERGSVAELRRGCTFHKLPYLKGSPHERFFKVSEDLRRIKWRFLPTRTSLAFLQRARELDPVRPPTKQVFLTDVQDIRPGTRTANFSRSEGLPARYAGMAAFSIVTRDRTIDLLCPDAAAADRWARGLAFLVLRLRPPPPPLLNPEDDVWTLLAHLRRGAFLLKFGQIGTPHERYFRVSADMRQLLWRRGEEEGGGERERDQRGGKQQQQQQQYRTVDLSAVGTVRLFAPRGRGLRGASIGSSGGAGGEGRGKPSLGPLAWGVGVEEYQLGFSLLNPQGQAELNLVAPNARVHAIWAEGLTRIVRHFQQGAAADEQSPSLPPLQLGLEVEESLPSASEPLPPLSLYDRGEYLALAFAAAPPTSTTGAGPEEAASPMPTQAPPPAPAASSSSVAVVGGNGQQVQDKGHEQEEEEMDELGEIATMDPPPKLASMLSSSLVTESDDEEAEAEPPEPAVEVHADVPPRAAVNGTDAAPAAASETPLPPPAPPAAVPLPPVPPPQPALRPPAPAVLLTNKLSDAGGLEASVGSNVDPEGIYAASTTFLTFLQEPEVAGAGVAGTNGVDGKEEGEGK